MSDDAIERDHGHTLLTDKIAMAQVVGLYANGFTQKEIAAKLSMSQSTVVTLLSAAQKVSESPTPREKILQAATDALLGVLDTVHELRERAKTSDDSSFVSAVASFSKSAWIGAGILSDKFASNAPSISITAGPGTVVNVLNDYSQRLTQLGQPASQSTPTPQPVVVATPAREYNTRELPAISADIAARL